MFSNTTNIPRKNLALELPLNGNGIATIGTDGSPVNIVWNKSSNCYTEKQASFNGTSSYMRITDGVNLDLDFSINFTFQLNTPLSSAYQTIWIGYGTRNITLSGNSINGGIKFTISNGVLSNAVIIPTADIVVGKKHMITCTRSKTSGLEIFLDNISKDTNIFTGNGNGFTSGSFLGSNSGVGSYANCEISNFRQYSSVLTAKERSYLYMEHLRHIGPSVQQQYPELLNGVVSYYDFKGDANDIVGNNNGIITGATLTTDNLGNSNSAYNFNGINNYIQTSNTFDFNGSRTYSFLINLTQTTTNFTILDKYDGTIQPFNFIVDFTQSKMGFYSTAGQGAVYSNVVSLTAGWHLLTYKRSYDVVYWYLDGTYAGGVGITATQPTNTVYADLGRVKDFPTYAQFGISLFMVHNRALSHDEVSRLYALTSKKYIYHFAKYTPISLPKPILYLDGTNNGTTMYDQSGNGYNGVMANIIDIRKNQSKGYSFNGTSSQISNISYNLSNTSNYFINIKVKIKDVPSNFTSLFYWSIDDIGLDYARNTYSTYIANSFTLRHTGGEANFVNKFNYTDILNKNITVGLQLKNGNQAVLFVDGIEYDTVSITGYATTNSLLRLGLGQRFLNGDLYDFQILPGILSAKQVEELFYANYI